jgi:ribosomal protein L33
MAKIKKVFTHLACEVCKSRNYTQRINTKNRKIGSLLLHKFCQYKTCRTHRLHKEAK